MSATEISIGSNPYLFHISISGNVTNTWDSSFNCGNNVALEDIDISGWNGNQAIM